MRQTGVDERLHDRHIASGGLAVTLGLVRAYLRCFRLAPSEHDGVARDRGGRKPQGNEMNWLAVCAAGIYPARRIAVVLDEGRS
jgi:hypothetical protein